MVCGVSTSELFELREDLHTNQIMSSQIIPMLERGSETDCRPRVGFASEQVILIMWFILCRGRAG